MAEGRQQKKRLVVEGEVALTLGSGPKVMIEEETHTSPIVGTARSTTHSKRASPPLRLGWRPRLLLLGLVLLLVLPLRVH